MKVIRAIMLSTSLALEGSVKALQEGVAKRNQGSMIHHSDRGVRTARVFRIIKESWHKDQYDGRGLCV